MEPPSYSADASLLVEVLYYVSRNGQLDHPHLLQITLRPSHTELRLRDVKKKLALIRGERFPSAFAWSCKRSYKKGYVWQDLCDDDLIFAAQGREYVLKASEIMKGIGSECKHACASGSGNAAKHRPSTVLEGRIDVSTQTEEEHSHSVIIEELQNTSGNIVNRHTALKKNSGHEQRPHSQNPHSRASVPTTASTAEKDMIGMIHVPTSPSLLQKPTTKGGLSTRWHDNHVLEYAQTADLSMQPSKSKHSGALNLLQFISCGGIDIRDDVLPMPTYNVSSTSSTPLSMHMSPSMVGSPLQLSDAPGHNSGQVKIRKGLQSKKAMSGDMEGSNSVVPVKSRSGNLNRRVGSMLGQFSDGLQDIISIGRVSVSDRSGNVSRELDDQQPKMHQEMKDVSKSKSGSQLPASREIYHKGMVVSAPASGASLSSATKVSSSPSYTHVAELWHELSRSARSTDHT